MKICQINCVYGNGSTGKIVRDIHLKLLNQGISSIVIYPVEKKVYSEQGLFTVSNRLKSKCSALYRRLSGNQFGGAFLQTNKIINILKEEKPDIVHLHCINGNNINIYRLLDFLSSNLIPTIITLHAEFMYTGGCGHAYECEKWKTGCGECPILHNATESFFIDATARTWKRLHKCYDSFKTDRIVFTAVSPWLLSRANEAPMIKRFNKLSIINGVDTNIYHCYEGNSPYYTILKESIDKYEGIVFHATALFDTVSENTKGGKYVVRLAEQNSNIAFVVAANNAKVGELPPNVYFVGGISEPQELAKLYACADVSLIVGKKETFSMPLAESLCCGTPVVGFYAGGPESIAIDDYCRFADYGDIDTVSDNIQSILKCDIDKQKVSSIAKDKYDVDVIMSEYEKLYLRMCSN